MSIDLYIPGQLPQSCLHPSYSIRQLLKWALIFTSLDKSHSIFNRYSIRQLSMSALICQGTYNVTEQLPQSCLHPSYSIKQLPLSELITGHLSNSPCLLHQSMSKWALIFASQDKSHSPTDTRWSIRKLSMWACFHSSYCIRQLSMWALIFTSLAKSYSTFSCYFVRQLSMSPLIFTSRDSSHGPVFTPVILSGNCQCEHWSHHSKCRLQTACHKLGTFSASLPGSCYQI